MKRSQKVSGIKRVFTSVKERTSFQDPRKSIQNSPQAQPSRFTRKKTYNLRCYTPDQSEINQTIKTVFQRPSYRRSLTPFSSPPKKDPICSSYSKLKENEQLFSIPTIGKVDTLCMPYELNDEKNIPTRAVRTSIRNSGKNIDLKKGSFSKKQIVSEADSPFRRENEIMTKSVFQLCDESTTGASRTPSPVLLPRNNRCLALSKNFKINRKHLANEAEKQFREKSMEEGGEVDVPWISILKDLESALEIKDFTTTQCYNDRTRVPARIGKV
ncbi:hypothetical protein SteCoe_26295 [Stentor coeruleus]|uniref:Uncharacterized protein n=1 Tax=Stentor coeruleus TaxID=5963 RepID=A0A1R2BD75_9CILI|nr:hypothetical protein SteCoe_26295 [Stentor coeruleus]